ncbi:bifunctional serine/threonine-protein kinase/formylglycine-generating enzyme family protein [Singulisphaera rosea]
MNERDLFLAALEISDPVARRTYLCSACEGNAELIAAVGLLLASHDGQSQFLNVPVVGQIAEGSSFCGNPTMEYDGGSGDDRLAETRAATVGRSPLRDSSEDRTEDLPLSFLQRSTQPGTLGRLGHYEITHVLGRGAFGIVLKAFDEKLHRVVAIKVLLPEIAATSPARKRFLREARSAAAVRHEHVVNIHAVEELPLPYLVMEYIPGLTLQQRLKAKGPLDVVDALRLGMQIAEGLAAAAAKGLIHRDIKPGNILLEEGIPERVKITDFGLARASDDASLTQSGLIVGTPMYMAPEQALGKVLDPRADLFSLGSVLYQMVSGRQPFRASSTMAVLKRVVEDTPRPIRDIIPETPQWLCVIIAKLHAKDPDDRYVSAAEVADLLRDCLVELQHGRIPVVEAPATATNLSLVPPHDTSSLAPARRSRHPRLKIAAIFLVFLTGLGITEATGVTKLIPTVIRWTDGSGTLVVETDDPDVGVTIDGKAVSIRGAGVEEFSLRPGKYHIAALKDGRAVKQELVTITRHRRSLVRISLDSAATRPRERWHGWPADAPIPAIAPFDSGQAEQYQEEWAAYLNVPVEFTNTLGMRFRLIPPGKFLMGRSNATTEQLLAAPELSDLPEWLKAEIRADPPERTVTIREPFYLGVHEVTQGQFRRFVAAEQYKTIAERRGGGLIWSGSEFVQAPECIWNNPKYATDDALPVGFLHLGDAKEFCTWMSGEDGVSYAIPTEAQWEFSCRAGTTTLWNFGDSPQLIRDFAWTRLNSSNTLHPVGKLKANPFGLFDMHGNAMELAFDGVQWVSRSGKATERVYFNVSTWRAPPKPNFDYICYESGFRVAITGDLRNVAKFLANRKTAPMATKNRREK